ncbi:ferritin-like domain-containing protein [Kitasatospora sp. NPDC096147]|uniref:ferritin-like domain-containing protein n=1 Tax=Kitasatospora sp. NPDC096147 TaxID=3364093 RepID=UPI0038125686
MPSLTRRSLLALGALTGASLLICGCTDEEHGPAAEQRQREDADRPVRTKAVADTDLLLAGYDAVAASAGSQAEQLRTLRAEVAEHRAALAAGLPSGSATPSASPSGSATPAPSGSGGPVGSVAQLAAAERTTAQARLAQLGGASPELARLLAAVAASGAVHAEILGDRTPLAVPGADTAAPSASPSATATATTASASATPAPLPAAAANALQSALAAEHAAVYGYGVVGARTPGPGRGEVFAVYATHQAQRDTWQRRLSGASATPTAAAAGYQLPFPVTSPETARQLAAHIEVQLTGVYAELTAASTAELRQSAATALRTAALNARRFGGELTAFPGLPATGASGSPSASGSSSGSPAPSGAATGSARPSAS